MSRITVWVSHAQDGDIGAYAFDRATGRFQAVARHPAEAVVMPMALSWHRRAADPARAMAPAAGDTPSASKTDAPHAWLLAAARADDRHIVVYHVVDRALSASDGSDARDEGAPAAPRHGTSDDAASPALVRMGRAGIASSLAYLEIDPAGRIAIGASYGENRVSVYDVETIFRHADPTDHGAPQTSMGKSDNAAMVPARQVIDGVAHAHAVVVSADGRHAYVSALGSNEVWCFNVDAQGQLAVSERVNVGAGFGPRHMRLSANGDRLFVLSEFQGVVATYARAPETGLLTYHSTSARSADLSALIQGRARPNFSDPDQPDPSEMARWIWAADLQLTPDNRFLYLTERTSSRIVVHAADEMGGWRPVSSIETETQPRGIAIDATGQYLFACGERSDFLSAYRIDPSTGALQASDRVAAGKGANWITIAA